MKSKKLKTLSIVVLVVMFLLTLKIGCPGDLDGLLKYMFHEEFPEEYEVTKRSETTLFHYLFGERKCMYEIEISRPDNNELFSKLKGTKFWRDLHAAWKKDPCRTSPEKYCDESELQHINKVRGTGLICYANIKPSSLILILKCYDV
jgi:hypothetical protein